MLNYIESVLLSFRNCFSRERSFKWFTVIVSALMIRSDHLGVTSIIRDLCLDHTCYEKMLHFFRSRAYNLQAIRKQWYEVVLSRAPLYRVNDRAVLIGDGVKQSKEARRMPGVKKMIQESETCSKPEYIHGHLFGAVGVVISDMRKKFCLPLKVNLQDGLKPLATWKEAKGLIEISEKSHVEQMIEAGFEAAKTIGSSFLLLDRYFLSRPALELFDKLNAGMSPASTNLVEIVTKAKVNCIAYRHPHNRKGSRGRPKKRGSIVKLSELFNQQRLFKEATVIMYGHEEPIRYYSLKLLWGQGFYRELRFVLVEYNGKRSILVCTNAMLDAITIIELYATRFGIEESFREFKQQIGGFGYHFWTQKLPKLNHFAKKDAPDPLESIVSSHDRKMVVESVQAIESFVMCASIAMGILQLLSLSGICHAEIVSARYLRTYSNATPSEATVMYYLRKRFLSLLTFCPHSFVTQYIREHQNDLQLVKDSESKSGIA